MQFTLTENQAMLAQSVNRFVNDNYGLDAWRASSRSEAGFSVAHWETMAGLGWLSAAVPEAYGGLGLGAAERMSIMEGFGRGLVLEPYLTSAVLAADLLLAAGSEAQKQETLPRICEGSLRVAFAQAEPGSRFALRDVACEAHRHRNGFRLSGKKIAVLDAPSAHKLIVLARTSGSRADESGLSLFWVDAGAAGLCRQDYPTVDGRRCSDIRFDGVELGAQALIGAEDMALEAVEPAVDRAIAALCAEAVGAMGALIDTTVEYLKTRRQFGRPLAEFQVLRHRIADMTVACEQARSLAVVASGRLDGPGPARRRAVSAAKVQIGKAGRFIGESAVQLHGGIGVSDELIVGHYLKRLMAIDALFGNADFHLERFQQTEAAH